MRLPGFSAEASLSPTSKTPSLLAPFAQAERGIYPAQFWPPTNHTCFWDCYHDCISDCQDPKGGD
jgi:hypothetical protein